MRKYFLLVIHASLCLSIVFAQKKPINHSVYDDWQNITNPIISKSGNIIYYQIAKQEGDNTLEVKNKNNITLLTIDRGSDPRLSNNEKYFISLIKPFYKEIKESKNKKNKDKNPLTDSLYIHNFTKDTTYKISRVNSYKMALHDTEYLAYITESEVMEKTDTSTTDNALDSIPKKSKDTKKTHKILHVLNLSNGDSVQIPHVDQYHWSPNEKHLVYTIVNDTSKDSTLLSMNGIYIIHTESLLSQKISSYQRNFNSFTFDDDDEKLVFLADNSDEKALLKDYKVYFYSAQLDSAIVLLNSENTSMPNDWYISGSGRFSFSQNGQKLYLGISPIPAVKDTSLIESDHAKLDIWHWKDDYLQTQQLVTLHRDRNQSFPAVYHFGSQKLIPLSDEKTNRVSFTDDANEEWALVHSNFGHRISAQWEGSTKNRITLVSTETGQEKVIYDEFNGTGNLSPDGNYVLLFDRDSANWISYQVSNGQFITLNEGLPISFVHEDHDMPSLPRAYGMAAWSSDGKSVAIYDRYDIWSFKLNGSDKKMITNGYGRDNGISLRYLDLSDIVSTRRPSTLIDLTSEVYLTAFDETTKYKGLYKTFPLKNKNPQQIILAPHTYKNIHASSDKKSFIYTKEDYIHSPDLYLFHKNRETQLSFINPQQQNYNWGTAEHIKWVTPNGHEAEGILYKPEDFDPNKKYPVIAYFYEKLSQDLYSYHPPAPTPSRLNIPYFVSNGYLVFAPDIRYEIGHPGRSAEEYVNSGMKYLAQNSWVDSTKLGIQGQSWGGYQVAHLITRTDMYAAAWAGAPVVNMTSAYGGIRWQTGLSRQFQYENTQSRIGKNLWEAHDLYIQNSPLFFMDRVKTPVAIMHNDEDGAVPWYQGIEMFTALRRLQKPVWLLNYNGDAHNLMKRENRKDIQIREAQFFDHFLKGKPAAPWIEHGVPAIKKGIDWGL